MNRKDMDNFIIRAYGKSELAMLYFPHSNNPHTARITSCHGATAARTIDTHILY